MEFKLVKAESVLKRFVKMIESSKNLPEKQRMRVLISLNINIKRCMDPDEILGIIDYKDKYRN